MSDWGSFSTIPFFPVVVPAQLDAQEAALGISFPDDYKQFLLSHNGGYPTPQQLDIPKTGHSVLLDVLYGIGEDRVPGDLVYEFRRHLDDLPEGFIPIGHDPGACYFLMGTTGKYRGRVYFWDRTWFFKESSEKGNTYWLSDSFTGFLNSLYEAEDE
jgi:hypothetical protein